MKHPIAKRLSVVLTLSAAFLVANPAAAQWKQHRSSTFGISMLLPAGVKAQTKAIGDWGAVYAEAGPAKLLGLARLGKKSSAAEIEAFGVKLTGVPAKYWKAVDSGRGKNGWVWYKAAVASDEAKMAVAIYGHGPRGSYLLLLATTVADYKANQASYDHWFKNLRVF